MFRPYLPCLLCVVSLLVANGEEPLPPLDPPVDVSQASGVPQPLPAGFAILHVDVPNGAIVEINGQRTHNRSWSRYRHYWITGLDEKPKSIVVGVHLRKDSCRCTYQHSECDCGYTHVLCCKTIELRAGDEEHLCFLAQPPKTRETPDAPTPALCLEDQKEAKGDVEPLGAKPEDEQSDDREATRQSSDTPKAAARTLNFNFDWGNDAPVYCRITSQENLDDEPNVLGVSFSPAEVSLRPDGPIPFEKSLLANATLAARLRFFAPGDESEKEFSFSPRELAVVKFDEVTHVGTFHLRRADLTQNSLYERLREAILRHLKKNLFVELEGHGHKHIHLVLDGFVQIEQRKYDVGRPLRIAVRMLDATVEEQPKDAAVPLNAEPLSKQAPASDSRPVEPTSPEIPGGEPPLPESTAEPTPSSDPDSTPESTATPQSEPEPMPEPDANSGPEPASDPQPPADPEPGAQREAAEKRAAGRVDGDRT